MNDLSFDEPDLRWRDIIPSHWLKLIYLLGTLIALSLISLIWTDWRSHDQDNELESHSLSKSIDTVGVDRQRPDWLIPEPLPFPSMTPLANGVKSRFKIPAAEFQLSIEHPDSWSLLELSEEQVRFQAEGEGDEYAAFATGCFGDCDRMEENIAESLAAHVERDHHRGLDPRVVHWYVHNKTWVEYSLLYRKSDGRAWMTGISFRWTSEWLNAIKCTYQAPVLFPYESERVLHLAWDIWAVEFIRYCRQYEVLSWE